MPLPSDFGKSDKLSKIKSKLLTFHWSERFLHDSVLSKDATNFVVRNGDRAK